MKITSFTAMTNKTNAPKVNFTGRAHQVKTLLDKMEEVNQAALVQLNKPAKFVQNQVKKLNIF